ncbi:MAG: alkaline phosphatase family protein, partial [Acidobacteriota bacterium]|nr:alkaline phosphatase family protein [Acidobacteriota bacterium]
MTRRTVLIGLDGSTFSIHDPLMRDGVMPCLSRLIRDGVRANLRTVIPALTPPAWTSLTTGRGPGSHGIFDFFRLASTKSRQLKLLTSRDIACETVWELASRNGLRSTVINFPLTYPAPAIDGFVVPGWMPWKQVKLGCYPKGLYERIRELPEFDPHILGFDFALEEKSLEGCAPEEYAGWIDFHIRKERQLHRILRMLMKEDPCELTAIMFDGVDKLQHLFWRFIDPAFLGESPTDWELEIRGKCLDYFREIDGIIEEIVDLAGGDATIVLASDHGFGAQEATLFVNHWLAERGYLAWAGEAPKAAEFAVRGLGKIGHHAQLIDWSRTKAYALTPSGNGVHIVREGESGQGGVTDAEYDGFRERLCEELKELVHPVTNERLVKEIWTREEAFAGPFIELAPDLTLVLSDGGLVSILAADAAVQPMAEPSGTHRPEGIFVAHGPGLRSGAVLDEISILDVAPL